MPQKSFFLYSFGAINEEALSKQHHYRAFVPLCPSPIEYRLYFARNRRNIRWKMCRHLPKIYQFWDFLAKVKVSALACLGLFWWPEPNLYEAHLRYQFRHACGVIKNDFVFVSFHDKSLSPLVKKLMEEELQLRVCEYYKNKTMKLYETKCTPWIEQLLPERRAPKKVGQVVFNLSCVLHLFSVDSLFLNRDCFSQKYGAQWVSYIFIGLF